jgi:dipeptidase E
MNNSRKILLISNSYQHGSGYLEHCKEQVKRFFQGCNHILFVPYALHDWNQYADMATKTFESFGFQMTSVHAYDNKKEAVMKADGLFISGGNTFRLLDHLYKSDLIDVIRLRVLQQGMPYMGTSAGSNVACLTIKTTNDMPIVYPPSFDALSLVPFQLNPHFIDAEKHPVWHMGETREKRIAEFHEENDTTVIGLREGAMLLVQGNRITLEGINGGKLFVKGKKPQEIQIGDDLTSHLI